MVDIFGFKIHNEIVYGLLTLVICYIVYRILLHLINKAFILRMKKEKANHRRYKTTQIIVNNILKYTFGVIVLFAFLGILGVNAGAIIASIGVIGLAIGLAVQDILKDILAGIFILTENQYAVGDTVSIGGFKGEVIFLGLKSTKLKSETGEIKILSNRNISDITNYSLNNSTLFIDVELAYDNDEGTVTEMFNSLVTSLSKKIKNIDGNFKYEGIQSIGGNIKYRISVSSDIKYQNEIKSQVLSELKKAILEKEIRR